MRKRCSFLVILMLASLVFGVLPIFAADKGDYPVCNIGADPVNSHRVVDWPREIETMVTEPILVDIISGSGKVVRCYFMGPAVKDRETGCLTWAKRCGNDFKSGPLCPVLPPTPPTITTEPPAVVEPPRTDEPAKPSEPIVPESPTEPREPHWDESTVDPFIGPTVVHIPWGNDYENAWPVNGFGIEGGVQIDFMHTIFAGVFAHRRPDAELKSVTEPACWEEARATKCAPRWPCLTAEFSHRAVDASTSWGAELGYRYTMSPAFGLGPSVYHVAWGSPFKKGGFVNGYGLSAAYDFFYQTGNNLMVSLDVARIRRPELPGVMQATEVCWSDYGNACKTFAHVWPGTPAETVTTAKIALVFWF